MNTKIIKLDINKKMYETISAKQGDTESRFLLFHLFDSSLPFDLTEKSVRVYGIKPDEKKIFNDLVINDAKKGYCTLELTNQMLSVAGLVKLELVIYKGSKKLSSIPFVLNVISSLNSEDAIVSTNEFTALMNGLAALSEYDTYKSNAKQVPVIKEEVSNLSAQLDNIVLDVTKYGCKIDGVVDDTLALQRVFDIAKNNKNIRSIVIPKTGKEMILSNTVRLDRSNIELIINSNIKFTTTEHKNVFIIGGDGLNKDVTVKGGGITIDGNGDKMLPLEYVVGSTPSYSCITFTKIDGLKVNGINFNNGLVESCVVLDCGNFTFENCEFNNSNFDNGLSIYNTVYGKTFDETNSSSWTNGYILNCKANKCTDFGMTAFKTVNVVFENCIATNCGNYTDSRQVNKGGGFSIENFNVKRNSKNKLINCKAINCIGRGVYIDADDVNIDSKCEFINILSAIRGDYSPTNDDNNNINGIGVRLTNNTNCDIGGIFSNCNKAIVYQSWNDEKTSTININNVRFNYINDIALYCDGIDRLLINDLQSTNTNIIKSTNTIHLTNINDLIINSTSINKGVGNSTVGIYGIKIENAKYNVNNGDLPFNISATNKNTFKFEGTYNSAHPQIGDIHLWSYNNTVRVKNSKPTYNTDGDLLFRPFTSKTFTDNATSIDASDVDLIIVNNTVATTLSTITGSYNGKIITIVSTSNDNTKLEHSGVAQGFRLNGKADLTLTQHVPIRLQYFNYSWYQI